MSATLDIWELLSGDKRIIVRSHLKDGMIVTWEPSLCVMELWSLQAERAPDNRSVKVGWKLITSRPIAYSKLDSFPKVRAAAEGWLSEFVTPDH